LKNPLRPFETIDEQLLAGTTESYVFTNGIVAGAPYTVEVKYFIKDVASETTRLNDTAGEFSFNNADFGAGSSCSIFDLPAIRFRKSINNYALLHHV